MVLIDLNRLPNETDYEYHKRLIYGKMEDKSLFEVDYSTLSELVYGEQYSNDFARKMIYGSYRTLKKEEQDPPVETERGVADSKMVEIRKEQRKLFDQRREYMKLVSEEGRREHLEDMLIAAADNLSNTVGCMYGGYDHKKRLLHSVDDTEAVLVLSDWHYGMIADNIWNSYNTEVCKERVKSVIKDTVNRVILHGCSRLHVVVLGDLIHGAIHVGARVASEELVCEQIMNAAEILAQSIEELSNYVQEVVVYVTYGNHARTVQKKDDSTHRDNMERIIPWWLAQRLKDYDCITIMPESTNEFLLFNVCGREFCATHGDLDSVKAAPRLIAALLHKRLGKDIDYILLGDKHHRESFEELGVTAMICGSLCGSDEYANTKRLYSTPEQTLLIVSSDVGVDAQYHLKCC